MTDDGNLRDFIAKHAKLYNPETDTYDRPPFTVDIKEGKNDPIYSAHSYHTKVPPRSIIPYILHYTEPGDLILDPFCGSGMTGVAAVTVASATHLALQDEAVDYIFTDPPFGSNIYYSEPNLLWEAWLDRTTDTTFEAVVHRKNDGGTKRLGDYAQLMQLSFAEMYRVLKPGRWATVEFNNSDGAVFEAIKQAIRSAGFEIVNMLLLDKKQKTFKQVKGAEGVEDVVDKDVLFNLHKPALAGSSKTCCVRRSRQRSTHGQRSRRAWPHSGSARICRQKPRGLR